MSQNGKSGKPELSVADAEMVRQCRALRLDEKFVQVVRGMTKRPPTDMEAHFEKFVAERQVFYVRGSALRKLRERFGRHVDLQKAFGVALVLVGGKPRHIASVREVEGMSNAVINEGIGYAPVVNRLFLAALEEHSVGSRRINARNGYLRRS